mmetsp:Transcript_5198/g.15432  ORF Transcript_5198/g.15432 Transcript_5198/m.15432 type:complete len:239 (+) Transcript_5198:466-1182(+)
MKECGLNAELRLVEFEHREAVNKMLSSHQEGKMLLHELRDVRSQGKEQVLSTEEQERLINRFMEIFLFRYAAVDIFDGLSPLTRACRKVNVIIGIKQSNANDGKGCSVQRYFNKFDFGVKEAGIITSLGEVGEAGHQTVQAILAGIFRSGLEPVFEVHPKWPGAGSFTYERYFARKEPIKYEQEDNYFRGRPGSPSYKEILSRRVNGPKAMINATDDSPDSDHEERRNSASFWLASRI